MSRRIGERRGARGAVLSAAWLSAAFMLAASVLAIALGPIGAAAQDAATSGAVAVSKSSCVKCHAGIDDDDLSAPAKLWAEDVHAAAGLSCPDCHGGDATPYPSIDDEDERAEVAMSDSAGFQSPPDRLEVADFCARCHSDPDYMKRFNPALRVDQLTEYRTSVHGILNAKGDRTPATCIDCHGAHGIQHVNSPKSPAYATNVPKLCSGCHSDAKKMEPYGIKTNQFELYMKSVHSAALFDAGDLSAPACNDCHGNHGATPPQVESVANVCGHCHGREGKLFHESAKRPLFAERGLPDCMTCHDHHLVRHPTPELIHGSSAPTVSAGTVDGVDPFAATVPRLAAGDSVTATWRVVLRPHIPPADVRWAHRVEVMAGGSPDTLRLGATVRPGAADAGAPRETPPGTALSARLAVESLPGLPVETGDAFRLDLVVRAGESAVENVRIRDVPGEAVLPHRGSACLNCHTRGDSCDVVSEQMYAALHTLDRGVREGEALLHRAELAGMEVSKPQFDLKRNGITAAVEAKALIHSFDYDRLIARAADGQKAATAARQAGEAALEEIQVRRRGLAVSLVLVAAVLLGLALKIREIDRRRVSESAASH